MLSAYSFLGVRECTNWDKSTLTQNDQDSVLGNAEYWKFMELSLSFHVSFPADKGFSGIGGGGRTGYTGGT